MPLILTVNPLRGGGHPETRTLGEGTISIGRGAVSDWVLADPERLLSKTHCMIGIEGSRYVLTDLSTNGVFINGAREPTARDSRVFLTDGDSFRLGDYTVTVTEVERVPAPREASYHAGSGASSEPGLVETFTGLAFGSSSRSVNTSLLVEAAFTSSRLVTYAISRESGAHA